MVYGDPLEPTELLAEYWTLLQKAAQFGPVIDLACGQGRNGVFLAAKGIPVILIDRSDTRLAEARRLAGQAGVAVDIRRLDLEKAGADPLDGLSAGGIMVFLTCDLKRIRPGPWPRSFVAKQAGHSD
jgi:tellurite methyltransferase